MPADPELSHREAVAEAQPQAHAAGVNQQATSPPAWLSTSGVFPGRRR
jgi:hypothetical protein